MRSFISYIVFIWIICGSISSCAVSSTSLVDADVAVAQGSYKKAHDIYKKHYLDKQSALSATDYLNMIELAKYVQDTALLQIAYDSLVSECCCTDMTLFEDFVVRQATERRAATCHTTFLDSLSMFLDRDQEVRNGDYTRAEILRIDSINYQSFEELYAIYGFPSFHNLDKRCYLSKGGFLSSIPTSIVIKHFLKDGMPGIVDKVNEGFVKKEISVWDYMYHSDYFPQGSLQPFPIIRYEDTYYALNLQNIADIDSIDQVRKSIGFFSLEKQIEYQKHFLFNKPPPFEYSVKQMLYTYGGNAQDFVDEHYVKIVDPRTDNR